MFFIFIFSFSFKENDFCIPHYPTLNVESVDLSLQSQQSVPIVNDNVTVTTTEMWKDSSQFHRDIPK